MNYRPHLLLLIAGLFCLSVLACAQEGSPQTGSGSPASGEPSQTVAIPGPTTTSTSPQAQPDNHPLAGAYLYTLGSALEGRSYFEPTFSVTEAAQTNPRYGVNAKQSFAATTIPVAQLSLVHMSRTNEFQAGYVGGAFIYTGGAAPNSTFHEAILTDTMQFRRWQLSFSDRFSYLPQASFGFGGVGAFGGLGALGGVGAFGGLGGGLQGGLGGGGGLINPMYTPNQ
ncbi:MAG: hypothetical protein ACRD1O_03355, partial [Terriglobia bacterium]